LPGIAERRLGVSLYMQPAELVLGAPSGSQCNNRGTRPFAQEGHRRRAKGKGATGRPA